MIKKRDVLRIKMPFPNISSALAVTSHMYICRDVNNGACHFIKCQTLKPCMIGRSVMKHYWDEVPNLARNPFNSPTRIDCDKEFVTQKVQYSDSMRTTNRPDVSQDVMISIESELNADGYVSNVMNESDIISLNYLASTL